MYAARSLSLIRPLIKNRACSYMPLYQTRGVVLKPTFTTDDVTLTYQEKNKMLKRPLSPHLSIYKFQITSVLSITHRITGLVFTAYIIALSSIYVSPFELEDIIQFIQNLQLSAPASLIIKTILAIPIAFHIANGVRHLIWDTGIMLSNQAVTRSGYTVLILTLIFSIALANVK